MSAALEERCALGKFGIFHLIPRSLQGRSSSSAGTLLKRSLIQALRAAHQVPEGRSSSEALLKRSAPKTKCSYSVFNPWP